MNIKKYTKKINKVSISFLVVGFIVGLAVMYLYFQPKLAYQEKLANNNQTLANQNHNEAVSYKGQLASTSAELKALQNKPTPTPQIIYKTDTVTQHVPDSSNTQSQLDAIQRNQQAEVMREQDSCLASGGLYSTVSGCNH